MTGRQEHSGRALRPTEELPVEKDMLAHLLNANDKPAQASSAGGAGISLYLDACSSLLIAVISEHCNGIYNNLVS